MSKKLPELAARIAPDWDLPIQAVESGLKMLRVHRELVQEDTSLRYEMVLGHLFDEGRSLITKNV